MFILFYNSSFYSNQPGHRSRECPEPKKARGTLAKNDLFCLISTFVEGGSGGFFGGGRKNDKVDIFLLFLFLK